MKKGRPADAAPSSVNRLIDCVAARVASVDSSTNCGMFFADTGTCVANGAVSAYTYT